jgi:alpha-D-ribose 1-methylphosphonate 5-triphosphate synthase subunit PhnG
MDRKAAYELLATLDDRETIALGELALAGLDAPITIVTPPTVGMVMARAIDGALGDCFNLGEVLVTQARVAIGDVEGWGMVVGSRPERALAVALVDGALARGAAPALAERLEALAAARRVAHPDWQAIEATRVVFDNF